MHPLIALLSTLPFTTATTTPNPPKDFTSTGQLRTIYIGPEHEDLGCLTATGKWTVDETQCGLFETSRDTNNEQSFRLFSRGAAGGGGGGGCGVDVATFRCGEGVVEGAAFGTFGTGVPVAGREVLRYAQYGVLATNGESPPASGEPAMEVHFYSGSEKGKWVWLGWKAVEDSEEE